MMLARLIKRIRACLFLCIGASCVFWVLEILFMWFIERELFNNVTEFLFFGSLALGVFLIASAVFGLLVVVVSLLADILTLILAKLSVKKLSSQALAYTLIASPWLIYISCKLFSGEEISQKNISSYGPYITSAVLLSMCYGLTTLVIALINRSHSENQQLGRITNYLLFILITLITVSLFLADATILVNLYVYVHITTAITVFLLVMLVLTLAWYRLRRISRFAILRYAPVIILSLPLLSSSYLSLYFNKSQTLRSIAYQRSMNEQKILTGYNSIFSFMKPEKEDFSINALISEKEKKELVELENKRPKKRSPLFGRFKGMNIVLFVMDGLRANNLSCYGYSRETSPYLDKLCEESVLFKNAYIQSQPQSHSMKVVFSSTYCKAASMKEHMPNLPSLLQEHGYLTGRVTSPHPFLWESNALVMGFLIDGFEKYKNEDEVTKRRGRDPYQAMGIKFVEEYKHNRFFLWLQLLHTHEPFTCPKNHLIFGSEKVDRYDACIHYGDDAIEEFVEILRQQGILNNTILIITADHGEAYNEHGNVKHGTTLYNEEIRIPLIMRIPGIEPDVVEENVGHADIFPTIIALLGIETDRRMLGSDLSPLLMDKKKLTRKYLPVFSIHQQRWAILHNQWKLIFTKKGNIYDLYDLKNDPGEKINLIDKNPKIVIELKKALDSSIKDREETLIKEKEKEKEKSVEQLLTILNESASNSQRLSSVIELSQKKSTEAIKPLIDIVQDEKEDLAIRRTAIVALGDIKANQAVTILGNLLYSKDYLISFNSLSALKKIGTKEAGRTLFDFLPKAKSHHKAIIDTIATSCDVATIQEYLCNVDKAIGKRDGDFALAVLMKMKERSPETHFRKYKMKGWRVSGPRSSSKNDASVTIKGAETETWPVIQPQYLQETKDGYCVVNLIEEPTPEQAGTYYYASTWSYSPTPRTIYLLYGNQNGIQVKLNDKVVIDDTSCRNVTIFGKSHSVELIKGWNHWLVRVEGTQKACQFYLTIFDKAITDKGELISPLIFAPTRRPDQTPITRTPNTTSTPTITNTPTETPTITIKPTIILTPTLTRTPNPI